MPQYVVLKQEESDPHGGDKYATYWQELGVQEGHNDLDAIKKYLDANNGEGGIYRGVPTRSWPDKPHDLKPKTTWV